MARAVSSIPSARAVAPSRRRRSGLPHQRLQRRLQPMRQIGGAGAGALGLGVACGSAGRRSRRPRAQFLRPVLAHALRLALRRAAIAGAEVAQRAQPTDSCAQPAAVSTSARRTQIRRQIGHEGAARGDQLGRLHRHRRPHRAATQPRGQRDERSRTRSSAPLAPAGGAHAAPRRPACPRAGPARCPRATGSARSPAGLLDLPVKPAIGPAKRGSAGGRARSSRPSARAPARR
jgi:hypothetical protein